MAKKNPAHMFRGKKKAYTRKEYIGGVPASRITQFDIGSATTDCSVGGCVRVRVSVVSATPCAPTLGGK